MDANEMLSLFQIAGTRVLKFTLKNDFVTLNNNNNVKCDASYSIESVDEQNGLLVGIIRLYVKASIKDTNKAKIACSIDFEGCFASPVNIGKDKFVEMLGINGCASLFSMSRAYISSATSLATSGGQLILPMINTFRLAKDGLKQQSGSTQ